jgi:hypothetical protein
MRNEPNFSYKIMRLLYKSSLSKIYPNIGVSFETLDEVMVEIGIHDANKIIFENNDIRQHE